MRNAGLALAKADGLEAALSLTEGVVKFVHTQGVVKKKSFYKRPTPVWADIRFRQPNKQ